MYEWKDQYCIGNDEIDAQHRTIFTICNRIENVLKDRDDKRNKRVAVEGVKYLKAYTMQHFENEERMQREIGYKDFERHKAVHDQFKSEILAYDKELEKSNYSFESVYTLLLMVKKWLSDHIMGMDQKITQANDEMIVVGLKS